MPELEKVGSEKSAKLLLLVTEQQAYSFDLAESYRIAIGRHDSNDLQLPSRTVSNYHAEILSEGSFPVIQDLRSTNGTYVNEEKVTRRRLTTGDRVRIGSYLIAVELRSRESRLDEFFRRNASGSFSVGARGRLISIRGGSEQARKTLPSRELTDVTLPDLLTFLCASEKSAALLIRGNGGEARVLVQGGRILHAECGRVRGEKALYRLFQWEGATYEVSEIVGAAPAPQTISLPADTLILEGMQQVEEMGKLVPFLPPLDEPLQLNGDSALPVCTLSPAEVKIFQALIRWETIGRVVEESPLTDFRVLRLIHSLLKKKIFLHAESPSGLLDETVVFRRNS